MCGSASCSMTSCRSNGRRPSRRRSGTAFLDWLRMALSLASLVFVPNETVRDGLLKFVILSRWPVAGDIVVGSLILSRQRTHAAGAASGRSHLPAPCAPHFRRAGCGERCRGGLYPRAALVFGDRSRGLDHPREPARGTAHRGVPAGHLGQYRRPALRDPDRRQ